MTSWIVWRQSLGLRMRAILIERPRSWATHSPTTHGHGGPWIVRNTSDESSHCNESLSSTSPWPSAQSPSVRWPARSDRLRPGATARQCRPATSTQAIQMQVAELEGSRHEASKVADRQVEGLRPQKRHLYLGTVGTARAMQGCGLATRTLAPLIQASDDAALEVWLETSSESNVNFDRRLGFEVEGHLAIQGGGPDVWVMVRRPVVDRV